MNASKMINLALIGCGKILLTWRRQIVIFGSPPEGWVIPKRIQGAEGSRVQVK